VEGPAATSSFNPRAASPTPVGPEPSARTGEPVQTGSQTINSAGAAGTASKYSYATSSLTLTQTSPGNGGNASGALNNQGGGGGGGGYGYVAVTSALTAGNSKACTTTPQPSAHLQQLHCNVPLRRRHRLRVYKVRVRLRAELHGLHRRHRLLRLRLPLATTAPTAKVMPDTATPIYYCSTTLTPQPTPSTSDSTCVCTSDTDCPSGACSAVQSGQCGTNTCSGSTVSGHYDTQTYCAYATSTAATYSCAAGRLQRHGRRLYGLEHGAVTAARNAASWAAPTGKCVQVTNQNNLFVRLGDGLLGFRAA